MSVQTSTGIVISISASKPATEDKAGYDALTFTAIGEVVSIGEYSATQEEVNHTPLSTGIVEKYKGATNNGSSTLEFGYDPSDVGQAVLDAGSNGANKFDVHSFKVTFSSGRVDYFSGLIFGYTKNPGAINNIVSGTSTVGINTAIVDGT